MRLTSKGRYAVRAMLDLTFNSNGSPVRLQEISNRQAISLHYLEQLFRKLRTGRAVKSVRGPGGGYVLSRSMDEITIRDVLECVGENINPAKDIVGLPSSGVEVANNASHIEGQSAANTKIDTREFRLTKTYFENLGVIMNEYLSTTTLGDLMRQSQINDAATQTAPIEVNANSATSDAPSEFASAIRSSIGEINQ